MLRTARAPLSFVKAFVDGGAIHDPDTRLMRQLLNLVFLKLASLQPCYASGQRATTEIVKAFVQPVPSYVCASSATLRLARQAAAFSLWPSAKEGSDSKGISRIFRSYQAGLGILAKSLKLK